ncbi:hypothetical protein ACIPJS_37370 [Streptomyces sp. NPDC086783]|uniref:hypothetical protein n=1 Tax=Streptomyces sp. NPDC086783 TaxID=3365758 RepID=UPI00382B11E2
MSDIIHAIAGPLSHQQTVSLNPTRQTLMPTDAPDRELMVGVNAERNAGVLEFMDDGNLVTLGRVFDGGAVEYYLVGNPQGISAELRGFRA